jgi:DNA-binding NarL/FixJ family response regulator
MQLEIATSEFRAMQMQPALQRARAFADRLGQRAWAAKGTGTARPAHPAGLSEREVEVLRLVAAGKTNREIAELLVVSPATIAFHLKSILNKTGVANRTEAASFAHRHGLAAPAG